MWPQGTSTVRTMNGNYLEVCSTLWKRLLRAGHSRGSSMIQYWAAPSLFSIRWLQALTEQCWFLRCVFRREQRRIVSVGPRAVERILGLYGY